MEKNGGVQGTSDPNRELLDAAALVGHPAPAGQRVRVLGRAPSPRVFLTRCSLICSRRAAAARRCPPIRSLMVMVLQSLEGLSDRDAIQALRTDLRWKVAVGLTLDDEGFHPTVLTLWRNKLHQSDRPQRIFDAVRDVVAATGVLAGKTRRALDSTLLDGRGREPRDRDPVGVDDPPGPQSDPRPWPAVAVVADDYDAGGKPACVWDDPAARDELITGAGQR